MGLEKKELCINCKFSKEIHTFLKDDEVIHDMYCYRYPPIIIKHDLMLEHSHPRIRIDSYCGEFRKKI